MYKTAPVTMSWKLLAGSSQPAQFHIYDTSLETLNVLE